MKKRPSAKLRAQAIADLQSGDQPAIVAERYGIPAPTVRSWKLRFATPTATPIATNATPIIRPSIERQQLEIGTLVLDLLRSKLEASAAIAKAASDPAWIVRQSGSELATLGEWLDTTAFAIGDRLAGRNQPADDSAV
jgi:hypothetical protein